MTRHTNTLICNITFAATLCCALLFFGNAGCSQTASQSQTIIMELDNSTQQAATNSAVTDKPSNSSNTTKPAQKKKTDEVRMGTVGVVVAGVAQIRTARSVNSKVYSSVKEGTNLAIIGEQGNWYGVLMSNGATGWVDKNKVELPGYDIMAPKQTTSRGGTTARDITASLMQNDIIRAAAGYAGVKYVFGGTTIEKGMDCSAYVRSVFSQFGKNLPRTSREQATVGKTIPFDRLQPGDRLYFACNSKRIDHCGIYAGDGYFIHCSSGKKGISFDTLASDFYWKSLVVAKR